jgi:hypothetical protein
MSADRLGDALDKLLQSNMDGEIISLKSRQPRTLDVLQRRADAEVASIQSRLASYNALPLATKDFAGAFHEICDALIGVLFDPKVKVYGSILAYIVLQKLKATYGLPRSTPFVEVAATMWLHARTGPGCGSDQYVQYKIEPGTRHCKYVGSAYGGPGFASTPCSAGGVMPFAPPHRDLGGRRKSRR